MTDYNDILHLLNQPAPFDTIRTKLVTYLKGEAIKLRETPQETIEIAYAIAGMAATDIARIFEAKEDPIDEFLR